MIYRMMNCALVQLMVVMMVGLMQYLSLLPDNVSGEYNSDVLEKRATLLTTYKKLAPILIYLIQMFAILWD